MICAPFFGEGENVQRLLNPHAADLIGHKPALLGRQPNTAENGL